MFGNGKYFGLRGKKLNYAVGIIAGIDFLYVTFLRQHVIQCTT